MKDNVSRVLIVDPDPLFAGRVRDALSSEGYDVEVAEGITQAVQRLENASYGCVIVDEALPEMKGYDAVPILRAAFPDLTVIMTAVNNTSELEARIRRQPIFFYHVKSFDIYELRMAVRNAFGKMEVTRE
ncbi:response regulator [Planctomycetota bacterium]